MTRINLVRPEDLADQHLFAEWREIKMIPARLKKLWARHIETLNAMTEKRTASGPSLFAEKYLSNIPKDYTLSTGHVTFFYDKMLFLSDRYKILTHELHERKYKIADHDARALFFDGMPYQTRTDGWSPRPSEVLINIERIAERLNQRPTWYRHYGEVKSPSFFIDQYNQRLLVDTIAKP